MARGRRSVARHHRCGSNQSAGITRWSLRWLIQVSQLSGYGIAGAADFAVATFANGNPVGISRCDAEVRTVDGPEPCFGAGSEIICGSRSWAYARSSGGCRLALVMGHDTVWRPKSETKSGDRNTPVTRLIKQAGMGLV